MKNRRLFMLTILILFVLVMPAVLVSQDWEVREDVDEMTEEKTVYVVSTGVLSTKPMGFPYADTKAKLCVGISKSSIWVYFWFSSGPNITNIGFDPDFTKMTFTSRVKMDGAVEVFKFILSDGPFIHIIDIKNFLSRLLISKDCLLELQWYGSGTVYFKFDLTGFAEAVEKGCSLAGYKGQ